MFCYNKQNNLRVTLKMPPLLTWHISQIIVDCLHHFVSVCISNQCRVHLLLSDALNFAMFMSLKFKDEIKIIISFDGLMEEDASVVLELTCLISNIKKEVARVLNYFPSFLRKYEENKICNMLSLMLDLVLKSFCLVLSFIKVMIKGRPLLKIIIQSSYIPCF